MSSPTDSQILGWLSTSNYEQKQAYYISQALKGSGQLLLESAEFKRWISTSNQVMLYTGMPGSGKTIMTSMVVDTLRQAFHNDQNVGVAFLYCDFNRQDEQQPDRLYAELLYQLGRQSPALPEVLTRVYQKFVDSGPKLWPYVDTLTSVISLFSRVFILVDGLDELDPMISDTFIHQLMRSQKTCKFNLFATSRLGPRTKMHFKDAVVVNARSSDEDIDKFVDYGLNDRLQHITRAAPQLRGQIKESIVQKADGMFLNAKLQLDLINSKTTLSAVKRAIQSDESPKELERVYGEVFNRIEKNDAEAFDLLNSTLMWLVCSRRHLRVSELQHALTIDAASIDVDDEDLVSIDTLLDQSGGLVTLVDGVVRLSHFSVREYLENSQKPLFENAEAKMAKICLTYLSFDTFKSGASATDAELKARLQKYPFYDYAAHHWGHHVHASEKGGYAESLAFLSTESLVASACQVLTADALATGPGYSQRASKNSTALHLAAIFNITQIVPDLLSYPDGPAPRDSNGHTPLWLATKEGHKEMMQLLSEHDRRTFRLFVRGKEKVLLQTLIRAASRIIVDFRKRTPLHTAIVENDMDMLKGAISAGVEVDKKDNDGATPLRLAITLRRAPMVDLLLNNAAAIAGVSADQWRQIYNQTDTSIVQLFEFRSGNKKVRFSAGSDLPLVWNGDAQSGARRLMICPSITMSSNPALLTNILHVVSLKFVFDTRVIEEEQINRHFIAVSVPQVSDPQLLIAARNVHTWPTETIRIVWTMTSPSSVGGKEDWISEDHISTLTHGSIPETGASFAIHLIQDLKRKWIQLCYNAEVHLNTRHATVLEKGGLDHTLIRGLLQDARNWADLRNNLRQHVEAAHGFRVNYALKDYNDKNLEKLTEFINAFGSEVGLKLTELERLSQNQIQIEFNLTSIAEAQKSTSTNRSMKRLTWITFIFLPLTFISGLLGMNVDILQSNPPWWWYVVLASIILILTLSVWITFKITDLEEVLEKKFARLVDRKKAIDHIDWRRG